MPVVGKKVVKKTGRKSEAGASSGSGDEHGTKNVTTALDELEGTWEGAEAKSFEKIPEGKYQFKIEKAEVNHSKNGRLQAVFELTVAGGEFVNRKVWKRDGLDNEESIGWFKSGLARLGIEAPSKMRELPGILFELQGTFCECSIKHKDDFLNAYFNKALDESEVDTDGLPAAAGEAEAAEPEEATAWKVGMKCQKDFDGDWYSGEIKKLKGDQATVLFEDGETVVCSTDDLAEVDDSEVEAGEEPEPEEPELELGFEEDTIDEKAQASLDTLAKKAKLKAEDFGTWIELIQELADKKGVTGEFPNVAKVIKALS